MRRVLKGLSLVLVVSLGVPALAADMETNDAMADRTVKLHRYVFNTTGPSPEDEAGRRCGGRGAMTVTRHHTAGDVAAAIFTSGWFTPVHATFTCAPPSMNP